MVPKVSLDNPAPPTTPVFFNGAAATNRDISVAITEAAEGKTFCDSMAGVGARGVRVANEVEGAAEVFLVDLNARALGVASRSASLNRVKSKCEFVLGDASSFLFSRYGGDMKFDCVDVDPFGSPIRQVPAAVSSTSPRGILSLTATDAAVLCGVYPEVSKRRYGASSLNNHFHHETGIRILLNAVRRTAASMDIGISPVAAHSTRHYLRAYVRVSPGATQADTSLQNEGYIAWCYGCGELSASRSPPPPSCSACGKRVRVAGPLWIGKLADDDLVQRAVLEARRRGAKEAERTLLSTLGVDRFPPWGFSVERICSSLAIPSVSEARVRTALLEQGYDSMAQPFETRGLKTAAPASVVRDAVKASRVD